MEPVNPGTTRVGWIGTGVMGLTMATHVLNAGYTSLTVYTRTPSKAAPLISAGAELASSPAAVAAASDVLFVMVGFPSDVRQVLLGSGPTDNNDNSSTGAIAALRQGGVVVDLTTSEPALASSLAATALPHGKHVLDAPVTGGDVGARAATLSVMVGGDAGAFAAVRPLIACFASTVTHMGPPGAGQHCKMANQITIASAMVGMCEGLLYAHAAGLDVETYIAAIAGGGAGSKCIELYAGRILKGDMQPGFFVEHFVKDLGIAVNECRRLGVALPGLGLASQLYNSVLAHGGAKLGTQALITVLEQMNGSKLPRISK